MASKRITQDIHISLDLSEKSSVSPESVHLKFSRSRPLRTHVPWCRCLRLFGCAHKLLTYRHIFPNHGLKYGAPTGWDIHKGRMLSEYICHDRSECLLSKGLHIPLMRGHAPAPNPLVALPQNSLKLISVKRYRDYLNGANNWLDALINV